MTYIGRAHNIFVMFLSELFILNMNIYEINALCACEKAATEGKRRVGQGVLPGVDGHEVLIHEVVDEY